jgi:ABC-2 type transport system permease protein
VKKTLTDTLVLARRSWVEGLRSPVTVFLFPIIFPVLVMLFTSQLYGRLAKLPGFPTHTYAGYLAPGAVMLVPMMGAGYSASSLILDARSGFLDRLRLMPIEPVSILLAKLIFEASRVIPAGFIVVLTAVAMGAPLVHGVGSVVGVVFLIALWSVAYSGLFYIVALRSANPQAPMALLPLCLPLLFVSPALVPTRLLPAWLRDVIVGNPFTYLVEAARALMTGGPLLVPLVEGVGTALAVLVLAQTFAIRLFGRTVRAGVA